MKNLSLITLIMLIFSASSFAKISEDVFAIDKNEVAERFSNLTEVEQVVVDEKLNLGELEASHPTLLTDPTFSLSRNFSVMSTLATMDDPPLGIPSFCWGLCCGIPGLAIVYFVTEDKDETKKALWGLITTVGVFGVAWLVLAILGISLGSLY